MTDDPATALDRYQAILSLDGAGDEAEHYDAPSGHDGDDDLDEWTPPVRESSWKLIDDDEPEPDEDEEEAPQWEDVTAEVEAEETIEALRARLARVEDQAKRERELRVQQGLKGWRKEAARRYPFASVDEIQAESKRAFMRAAQNQHNAVLRVVRPHLEAAEREMRERVREEGIQAWGKPLTGPGVVPVQAAEKQAEIERARETGDLARVLNVLRRR